MNRRFIIAGLLLPYAAAMLISAAGGLAAAFEVPVNYNLPWNEQNKAHLVGDMDTPLNETQEAFPHVYGTIPCTQYMSFDPATHAAAATGIAFTKTTPGSLSFENVSVTYGNALLGATLTTVDLKATIFTPEGTVGPVGAGGYFDNSYHYVEINEGTAHIEGQMTLIPFEFDFDLAEEASINQGQGTAGPITVSLASGPYNVSSGTDGYHATYDYTTRLTVPVNIYEEIEETLDIEGIQVTLAGTLSITGNFVTDSFLFSHTFDYYAGDANLDGNVDLLDLTILGGNWRGEGKNWGLGDFNGDGSVDLLDLTILGGNWRSSMSSTSVEGPSWAEALAMVNFAGENVPEPGTIVMLLGLALSLAGFGRLRRRS